MNKIKGIKGKIIVIGIGGSIEADENHEKLKEMFYKPTAYNFKKWEDPKSGQVMWMKNHPIFNTK